MDKSETVVIQGDTGKVMFTGLDITKLVDLSSVPNKIYTSRYLLDIAEGIFEATQTHEIEVNFNE
jgi:hypothetical protein